MKIHNDLQQGSVEWHAHRRGHFNASDAAAMLGCSPYKTRSQLLREYATGITEEVDAFTQRLYDDGHRFEALARPLAEAIVCDDLYPVTGSSGKLSASFDGLTMDRATAFEHKFLNDELRGLMHSGGAEFGEELPMHYRVQMEHQCMVSGSARVLFMASRWDGDELIEERHCWYYPDPDLLARIGAAWNQFEVDLANYVPDAEVTPAPVGERPNTLPALLIEVQGAVTASNLAEFKETALSAIRGINRELVTDEHFANADAAVKWCGEVESRLAAAKQHALSQTASIDLLFKTIDDISAEARRVRLDLDKLVTARKTAIRTEIVAAAQRALAEHVTNLNHRLGQAWMPRVDAGFADAIKGKKTVASVREAASVALANAKIEANAIADRLDLNRKALIDEDGEDWLFLFADFAAVGGKEADDFKAIVQYRVMQHREAQKARDAKIAADAVAAAVAVVASPPVPAPAVVPVTSSPLRSHAAADTRPPLTTGALCAWLGFIVNVDFIKGLGITPAAIPATSKSRSGSFWNVRDLPAIKAALVRHINGLAEAPVAATEEAVAA